MLSASLHFVSDELQVRLRDFSADDLTGAFTILTLSTARGGTIDLFGNKEQFKQLAITISEFLAAENAINREEAA